MKRKVLVTGAAGFIGSRAVAALEKKYDVYPLARLQNGAFAAADLADMVALEKLAPRLAEIDVLVHLAAQVPKQFSTEPGEIHSLLLNNLHGTANLLSCMPALKHVCLASTIEVYGRPERVPVLETAPCRPMTPYGLSKLLQEEYAGYFCRSAGIPLTVLRLATVYGPGEKYARAIPNFIRALVGDGGQQRPVQLSSGSGRVMRDYVHIDDAVRCIELAISKKKDGVFNVTGGRPVSMAELARTVARLCGRKKLQVERRPAGPNSFDNYLSPKKAAEELGFRAKITLEEGLLQEIEYFRSQKRSLP